MTISQLKEEIQSIVEARGVKTIQKDYSQVLSDIEKALDFYKKNKHTDKKDAFVKVLKQLGDKKKKLAQELDDKVSGMYKDAEYQGESVNEEKGSGRARGRRKEPKYKQEVISDVKKALELVNMGFYLVDNNTALEHKEGGYVKLSTRVTNFFNKLKK